MAKLVEVPWTIRTGQVFDTEPVLTPIHQILKLANHRGKERRQFKSFHTVQHVLRAESDYTIPEDFAMRLGFNDLVWQYVLEPNARDVLLMGADEGLRGRGFALHEAKGTIVIYRGVPMGNMYDKPRRMFLDSINIAGVLDHRVIAALFQKYPDFSIKCLEVSVADDEFLTPPLGAASSDYYWRRFYQEQQRVGINKIPLDIEDEFAAYKHAAITTNAMVVERDATSALNHTKAVKAYFYNSIDRGRVGTFYDSGNLSELYNCLSINLTVDSAVMSQDVTPYVPASEPWQIIIPRNLQRANFKIK